MEASASAINARTVITSESDGVALDFKRCRSELEDLQTPLPPRNLPSNLEIRCRGILKASLKFAFIEICDKNVNV